MSCSATEFHHLEIGNRFLMLKNPNSKMLKSFRGPFMKTGHFLFTKTNEYGESTGPAFSAMWHDPVKPISLEETIQDNKKNVLTSILV
jgi:hypothetical protein